MSTQDYIPQKNKVIVGMSGGVDSSVAAYLLKKQGYQVEGLFMKNWEEDDNEDFCSAAEDRKDAELVCEKLGIKLHTMNFAYEYWENVFSHFLSALERGVTPNPDILCNKEIKFKAFLDFALELGADYIATGHYVRKKSDAAQHFLLKGIDGNKDQSYFLYTLHQQQLAKSLFPVGELEKSQVRQIAKELGLITHDKKDSTGICFIGERRFKDFLGNYLPAKPGDIVTTSGEVIGQHDGVMYYTIGQRQGLNIGGRKDSSGLPWYVAEKDIEQRRLVVVQGQEHPLLYSDSLLATDLDWTHDKPPSNSFSCSAKTRYRQPDQQCVVEPLGTEQVRVRFHEPQRAVTPGQSVVFYLGEHCLGGGVIKESTSVCKDLAAGIDRE